MEMVGGLAPLLKEYGGWGLSAILMVAVIKLWSDNKALSTTYLERLIVGLNEFKQAVESLKASIIELRAMIDARGAATSDLAHQAAILSEKVIHGFGNTTAALDGIARRLEKTRDHEPRGRS